MSQVKLPISNEKVAEFLENSVTKPLAEITAICALIANSSDVAKASFASVFSGNIYIGLSDIERFNPAQIQAIKSGNGIIQELQKKAWYAFGRLIQEHYTPAASAHFDSRFLDKNRILAMGCPNAENINSVFAELADIQEAALELEAIKAEVSEISEGDRDSKLKFKSGSFEEKAMLIAKLCNLRNRITNITQPVHFSKEVVPSADETYQKILDLKNNAVGVETEIEYKCQVKIFNNGNIDLKLNLSYATTAFNLTLD